MLKRGLKVTDEDLKKLFTAFKASVSESDLKGHFYEEAFDFGKSNYIEVLQKVKLVAVVTKAQVPSD